MGSFRNSPKNTRVSTHGGFADGRLRRQVLGNGLTVDFVGELRMGAVSGVLGFGAMTPGLTTASGSVRDGARLEVAEFRNLPEYRGSIVDQRRERVGPGASFS